MYKDKGPMVPAISDLVFQRLRQPELLGTHKQREMREREEERERERQRVLLSTAER
jgi:hypothetical protein